MVVRLERKASSVTSRKSQVAAMRKICSTTSATSQSTGRKATADTRRVVARVGWVGQITPPTCEVPCDAQPGRTHGLQWGSVIEQPRREHSAKPEAVLELIEAYFPSLPKIELKSSRPAAAGMGGVRNEVA